MKRTIFLVIILLAAALAACHLVYPPLPAGQPLNQESNSQAKILLLPLDSRPPCRKFVIDAGRIIHREIITPPADIQDYYTQPGDTKALRNWLADNIDGCEAAIISVDQLLYGGLLSAREGGKTQSDIDEMLSFLAALHNEHPDVPLYVFNILPRITPPASIDGYEDRKNLTKYSRLTDEFASFDSSLDYAQLLQLEEKIAPEIRDKYCSAYTQNTQLNKQLSQMAADGIIARLVIGQDDSEDFGLPNMEKRQIQRYLEASGISEDKVFLTHGADEAALSMLASIATEKAGQKPKFYLAYNDEAARTTLMPYMAATAAVTAAEKVRLVHGEITDDIEAADFILFISCTDEKNLSARKKSAAEISSYLQQGKKVALVDLSRHFSASETVFPFLCQANVPLHQLSAYAGWNTASNSLGTAVSEAVCLEAGLQLSTDKESALQAIAANLVFLDNRYLEDYYYLKDIISCVDNSLKKAGYHNVYDLDMEHNYRWANSMLQEAFASRLDSWKSTPAFRQPVKFHTPYGETTLAVKNIDVQVSYPWPRTFEIYLQSSIWLEKLPD